MKSQQYNFTIEDIPEFLPYTGERYTTRRRYQNIIDAFLEMPVNKCIHIQNISKEEVQKMQTGLVCHKMRVGIKNIRTLSRRNGDVYELFIIKEKAETKEKKARQDRER